MSRSVFFSVSLLLLMVVPTATAITRQESVLDFVDSRRISDSGYANSDAEGISLPATVQSMQIKTTLNDDINNSLDILYYFQRLQDDTGGFASSEGGDPTIEATIQAVYGFQYLDINQSQYVEWQIFPFLNQSAQEELILVSNETRTLHQLTVDRMQLWIDYLVTSTLLGVVPTFPILELIDGVKNLQYANGSYYNFEMATTSIRLLSILGEVPNDADLAKKFILSFRTANGAFASSQTGDPTLYHTYRALAALDLVMDLWQLDSRTDISRFVFTTQQARSGFAEVESDIPTIRSTLDAIQILQYLGELDELNAPDVLQEVGFVPVSWAWLMPLILLPAITRRIRS